MNRYNQKFSELQMKNEKAFVSFVVLGDPDYKTSLEIIEILSKAGSDILELGLPFSDPIADGKTIQNAHQRALENNMNTDKAFALIKETRKFTDIPIGLLAYFNNIYAYGLDKFYRNAKKAGVDSVLIADLSLEESQPILKSAKKYDLDQIFIITQNTPEKRMLQINQISSGFVYLMAVAGVTGTREKMSNESLRLIKKVSKNISHPLCIGFGISKSEHVKKLSKTEISGIIVGSKIVSIIEENLSNKIEMLAKLGSFVKIMKKSTKDLKTINDTK